MIIKEINNAEYVLFIPENNRELKFLGSFPGLLTEGTNFFSPCKHRIVSNLYSRISKHIKLEDIKYTPYIHKIISNGFDLLELPDSFAFHTNPLNHQLQALKFLYTLGSCGLLLDPGLGKTKIILDYIFLMGFDKAIIVCPKPLLNVWPEEASKHRPELYEGMYVIQSTDWDKEKEKIDSSQVLVLNYDK